MSNPSPPRGPADPEPLTIPTTESTAAARSASAILLLARSLGALAEATVRQALIAARPDVMAKIGPTDPPDPGAVPST